MITTLKLADPWNCSLSLANNSKQQLTINIVWQRNCPPTVIPAACPFSGLDRGIQNGDHSLACLDSGFRRNNARAVTWQKQAHKDHPELLAWPATTIAENNTHQHSKQTLRTTLTPQQLIAWLKAYFNDPQTSALSLNAIKSLLTTGTIFQHRVWLAIAAIPCGVVLSYQQLATQCQSGARAVANACRANPLPLIIPCHRVVAKSGLGGYMGELGGDAVMFKRRLLAYEGDF